MKKPVVGVKSMFQRLLLRPVQYGFECDEIRIIVTTNLEDQFFKLGAIVFALVHVLQHYVSAKATRLHTNGERGVSQFDLFENLDT